MRFGWLAAAAAMVAAVPASAAQKVIFFSPDLGGTIVDDAVLGTVWSEQEFFFQVVRTADATVLTPDVRNSLLYVPEGANVFATSRNYDFAPRNGPGDSGFTVSYFFARFDDPLLLSVGAGTPTQIEPDNAPGVQYTDFSPEFRVARRSALLFQSATGASFELDNIFVSSVPEPSSWALMTAGVGTAAWGARRRKRKLLPA